MKQNYLWGVLLVTPGWSTRWSRGQPRLDTPRPPGPAHRCGRRWLSVLTPQQTWRPVHPPGPAGVLPVSAGCDGTSALWSMTLAAFTGLSLGCDGCCPALRLRRHQAQS